VFALRRTLTLTVFATQGTFATLCARRDEPAEERTVSSTDPTLVAGTRRQRLRRQTLRELEAAALAEVREHGPVGLSLRRVARRMGMSPAGLYRYVDSREALLTLLIARAYHALADHLHAALGGAPDDDGSADETADAADDRSAEGADDGHPTAAPPEIAGPQADVADRLRAVALAYRAWSVAHPNEFGLIFGDPIPGYEAPAGGPTVEAMSRVGTALATPLVEAWHAGRLRLHPALEAPELDAPLRAMAELGDELPSAVFAQLLLAWGRIHGQVTLEVFGHHHWLFPDGCEALYRAEVASMLSDLGVAPTAS
jgi:AcrR family transcriptional regulator